MVIATLAALSSVVVAVVTNLATSTITIGSNSTIWIITTVIAGLTIVSIIIFESKRFNEPSSEIEKRLAAAKILRDLAYEPSQSIDASPEETADIIDSIPKSDLLFNNVLSKIARRTPLAVLGPPGSGKSTLLHQIVNHYCTRLVEGRTPEDPLPIKISAASWKPGDFRQGLSDLTRHQYGISSTTLRKWSSRGEIVIVFDGLNEMYNPAALLREISDWKDRYPRCTYLISARNEVTELISSAKIALFQLAPSRGLSTSHQSIEDSANQWIVPEAALRVLVLAALEDGRTYEVAEISGLTMLPIDVLLSVLKRLTAHGEVLTGHKKDGRVGYTKKSQISEVAP